MQCLQAFLGTSKLTILEFRKHCPTEYTVLKFSLSLECHSQTNLDELLQHFGRGVLTLSGLYQHLY